jgi:hypothetical protein
MTYRIRTNTGCDHLSNEQCERCQRDWLRPPRAPRTRTFLQTVYEHMQGPLEAPIVVETPKQLRDMADARGLTSPYLEESIWRSGKRPPKWQ